MQLAKSIQKIDEKNSAVYEKLFNTAYYIATENESFRKFPQLIALQCKNGVEFGSNYLNEKACKDFCVNRSEVLRYYNRKPTFCKFHKYFIRWFY